jgi:hypothetical protein
MLMTPPRPGMRAWTPSIGASAATGQSRGGMQTPAGRSTTYPDPTARATNVQCPVRSSRECRLREPSGQVPSRQVLSVVGGNRSSRRSRIASRTRRLAARAVTVTVLGAGATPPEVDYLRPRGRDQWRLAHNRPRQPPAPPASTCACLPPSCWDARGIRLVGRLRTSIGSPSSLVIQSAQALQAHDRHAQVVGAVGHDTDAPVPNNGGAPARLPGGPRRIGWLWRGHRHLECRCPGHWRPPHCRRAWQSSGGTGPRVAGAGQRNGEQAAPAPRY